MDTLGTALQAADAGAIEALVELHRSPPGPFAPYDLETYLREASLLPDWYCVAAGLEVEAERGMVTRIR